MLKNIMTILVLDICQYKVLENYLNRMAKKGWAFKSMQGYLIFFTKEESPMKYYYVDVQMLEGKEKEAYQQMVEEYGYHFIDDNHLLQVFGSDTKIDMPIREYDEETRKQMKRTGRKQWLLKLLQIGLWSTLFLQGIYSMESSSFLDERTFRDIFMSGLLVLLWLLQLYPYVRWRIKETAVFSFGAVYLHTYVLVCSILFIILMMFPATRSVTLLGVLLLLLTTLWYLFTLWQEKGHRISHVLMSAFSILFALSLTYVLIYTEMPNDADDTVQDQQEMAALSDLYAKEKGYTRLPEQTIYEKTDSMLMAREYISVCLQKQQEEPMFLELQLYVIKDTLFKPWVQYRMNVADLLEEPLLAKEEKEDMGIYIGEHRRAYEQGDHVIVMDVEDMSFYDEAMIRQSLQAFE